MVDGKNGCGKKNAAITVQVYLLYRCDKNTKTKTQWAGHSNRGNSIKSRFIGFVANSASEEVTEGWEKIHAVRQD